MPHEAGLSLQDKQRQKRRQEKFINQAPGTGERESGGSGLLIGVYEIAQFFTWLEVRYALGWNIDLGAGLRIAPDARLALPDTDTAESANLDLVAGLQRTDNCVKYGVDNDFAVAPGKIA